MTLHTEEMNEIQKINHKRRPHQVRERTLRTTKMITTTEQKTKVINDVPLRKCVMLKWTLKVALVDETQRLQEKRTRTEQKFVHFRNWTLSIVSYRRFDMSAEDDR